MAKRKSEESSPVTPDLPALLAQVIREARENYTPPLDDVDGKECATLFELLSPCLVKDPRYKGNGEPPKVLREPLLMISWDRAAGAWKWAISDKVLNFSVGGGIERLAGATAAIEAALAAGAVTHKTMKPI